MSSVLITARMFPSLTGLMKKLADEGLVIASNPYMGQTLSESNLMEVIEGVDAAIVGDDYFTRSVIEKGTKLKIIAKFGVGVDRIDLQAAIENNVIVANAPGTNKHAVADLTIGLMLAAARKIPKAHSKVINEGYWKIITGTEIYGKTIGILGLGQIGKEVARRASGFDMTILAFESNPDHEFAEKFNIRIVNLEELLMSADFISINLPSLPSTKRIINNDTLSLVKPNSFLINTGRGDIIDENALYESLASGKLAGAALDVLKVEPPRTDHKLFKLENVVITPHIGAHTYESQLRTGTIAVENVLRTLRGEKPLYQVI